MMWIQEDTTTTEKMTRSTLVEVERDVPKGMKIGEGVGVVGR